MNSRIVIIILTILLIISGVYIFRISRSGGTGGSATTGAESAGQLWTCGMHPTVIMDHPDNCPICGMKLTPMKRSGGSQESSNAIYVDPAVRQNIGVRTAPAERMDLQRTIRATGLVAVDDARTFRVNLRFSGWIEKLYVNETGERVRKQQKLFDVYSPDLISAGEEYLLALKAQSGVGGETLLAAARDKLLNWGITPEQLDELAATGRVPRTLTIYSPAAGVIMRKQVVEGGVVTAGADLYEIADLSEVWVQAQIYEYELPWVKVGQKAMVSLPYDPDFRVKGDIRYIYPYLDQRTRTATIRLSVPNPNQILKPDMFADVDIVSRLRQNVVAVPREAVVRSGRRDLLFVDIGDGHFEPRPVQLGLEADEFKYEILSGVEPGEMVVISAQFLLDSELQLQEALAKLMAGGGSEADLHAAMGHSGHGGDGGTAAKTGKKLAEGATMERVHTDETLYRCPMHHEIVGLDADTHCPLCEMPLKLMPQPDVNTLRTSEPFGCVMCPVVVPGRDKDKRCPICEMKLKAIPLTGQHVHG